MRTHRAEPRHALFLALIAVGATAVLLATGEKSSGQAPASAASRRHVRSRELAATPPPMTTVLASTSAAARRSLVMHTSTTASWKAAATSVTSASGSRFT